MKKQIVILLGLISLDVYAADPTYDATRGALQNNSALCGYGYNPNCNQRGSTPPRKIIQYVDVHVPSKYGAYAANDKTGYSAGALNQSSLAKAKKEAIRACGQGGNQAGCKVVSWVRNGCIAGAKGLVGKRWLAYYGGGGA